MESKIRYLIFSILLCLSAALPAYAQQAPMTGISYGENIGIIHMDYRTALAPPYSSVFPYHCDPADTDCMNHPDHPEYDDTHFGLRNEFYIPENHPDFDNPPIPVTFGFDPDYPANISDMGDSGCDGTDFDDECLLHGYMWSDAIGWIVLDGAVIEANGGSPIIFSLDNDYAKVGYDGLFKGYIWSKKAGWIRLSSETSGLLPLLITNYLNAGIPEEQKQTDTNWGVWMFTDECATLDETACGTRSEICNWNTTPDPAVCEDKAFECVDLDETECNALDYCIYNSECLYRGRQLHGYAWSDHLGWIKFDDDPDDTDLDFGIYSTWQPDMTPPETDMGDDDGGDEDPPGDGDLEGDELEITDVWFTNTGPQAASGNLVWPNFAYDSLSGIDISHDENDDFTIVTSAPCSVTDISLTENPDDDKAADLNLVHATVIGGESNPDGYCKFNLTGTIYNKAGLSITIASPGINIYTMAGDVDLAASSLSSDSPTAVADGAAYVDRTFIPMDVANNPILPVKVDVNGNSTGDENLWMRKVTVGFDYDADEFYFDSVLEDNSGAIPVIANDTTYQHPALTDGMFSVDVTPASETTKYVTETLGLAPTVECGESEDDCPNKFYLNNIDFTVYTKELPALNRSSSPTPEVTVGPVTYDYSSALPGSDTYFGDGGTNGLISFSPVITIGSGSLDDVTINLGDTVIATFVINNDSPTADSLYSLSLDNLIDLNNEEVGVGIGEQTMEIREISLANSDTFTDYTETPVIYGRTDPVSNNTRYELSTVDPADVTFFHNTTTNPHIPVYTFYKDYDDFLLDNPSYVAEDGSYEVSNIFNMTLKEILESTPPFGTFDLDRTDILPAVGNFISESDSKEFQIGFSAVQFLGAPITTDVKFSMDHYLGYQTAAGVAKSLAESAIYRTEGNTIEDVYVKNPGVWTTGTTSGRNVYQPSDREFEIISTIPGKLKEIMRMNAAELSRDVSACDLTTAISGELTSTPASCVRVDTTNKTIVAVYEKLGSTQALTLGDGASDIVVPADYKYTIIVKGGGDIFIQNNITYGNDKSSLGLIVLAGSDGSGGNVYISPNPTNVVGLLYAEGSILSSPDGSTLYYGEGGGFADENELKNQLYWQGSIVSRNTIGGAPNKTIPEGAPTCTDIGIGDVNLCAQVYDLDYIRRFVTRSVGASEGYADDNVFFSGGGSCPGGAGNCSCPGDATCANATLPSCILVNGSGNIDLSTDPGHSKSTDSFFIERANRPIPPGFSVTGGFERYMEIRN